MKEIKNIIFSSDKEKLTEKVFKQSITISVVGILLCMIALCSATWAWFSTGISSPANNIRAAHCDVTVLVSDGSSTVLPENGTYSLQKNTAYTFTITADGTAENAYCVLNIDGSEYYTDQFDMVNNNGTLTGNFSFSLYFKDKNTDTTAVKVITRWGRSGTAATFENNQKYLDLKKVDEFPINASEVTTTDESTTAEPSNAETTAVTEPAVTSEITE